MSERETDDSLKRKMAALSQGEDGEGGEEEEGEEEEEGKTGEASIVEGTCNYNIMYRLQWSWGLKMCPY